MAFSNAPVRGVNVLVGGALGAGYLLVGALGFIASRGYDYAGTEGGKLLGIFMVNPLHNVVHLLIGALLLAGAAGAETLAGRVNTLVGGVYALLGVVGFIILHDDVNVLALNWQDNLLHFGSAGILLAAGLLGSRRAAAHA